MKRLALLVCAAALLLSGCKAQEEEPLLKNVKLRAAVTDELENSQEIAEYIAKELSVPLEISHTDRNTAIDMVKNGAADIAVGGFSESNDPGLSFLLTMPVAENRIYVVCGGGVSVTSTSDLSNVVTGASAELSDIIQRSLASVAADEKLVCDNVETAAELFASGAMQAYVCFEEEALKLISENSSLRCCIPADIEAEHYGILVLKSETDIFGAVNGIVGEMITGEERYGIF